MKTINEDGHFDSFHIFHINRKISFNQPPHVRDAAACVVIITPVRRSWIYFKKKAILRLERVLKPRAFGIKRALASNTAIFNICLSECELLLTFAGEQTLGSRSADHARR